MGTATIGGTGNYTYTGTTNVLTANPGASSGVG